MDNKTKAKVRLKKISNDINIIDLVQKLLKSYMIKLIRNTTEEMGTKEEYET